MGENELLVMNSKTWEILKETTIESASHSKDPIGFIAEVFNADIRIDETVPDRQTEIWNKDEYEKFLKETKDVKKDDE